LGKYGDPFFQATQAWPIDVVCPRTEQVFCCWPEDVEIRSFRTPGPMTNLWEISCDADAEQTRESKVAYTHTGGPDQRKAALTALGWIDSPAVTLKNFEW
jgi:hypothetical protein